MPSITVDVRGAPREVAYPTDRRKLLEIQDYARTEVARLGRPRVGDYRIPAWARRWKGYLQYRLRYEIERQARLLCDTRPSA